MRLYLLNLSTSRRRSDGALRSIRGYLVQTADGENILIDTGLPSAYVLETAWKSKFSDPIESSEDELLPAQLARAGITVDDLDAVVLTHSDYDHLGGIDEIPESVPVFISDVERALESPSPSTPGLPFEWPDRELSVIEFKDTVFRPGLHLLATPGHTPGHFSVLVELENTGPIMLAVDAIKAEIDDPAQQATDPDAAIASEARVRELSAQRSALLIYGHDGDQWATLRRAPEFYE